MTDRKAHLPYIDGLRAVAALTVLLSHSFWLTLPKVPEKPAWFMAGQGWTRVMAADAVALFILISGFCLMIPVIYNQGALKGGVRNFFMRRAWRILPPYYACLLVCWVIFGAILAGQPNPGVQRFPLTDVGLWSHLTLTHNFFNNFEFSGVLWSIAVECQIYLWFPLIVLLWQRFNPVYVSVAVVIVATILRVHWKVPGAHFNLYGLFALGNLAAAITLRPEFKKWRQPRTWSVVALILFAFCYLHFGGNANVRPIPERQVLIGLAGFALVLGAQPGTYINRFCSAKPLVGIGLFSYSLYLVHNIPVHLLSMYFYPRSEGAGPLYATLLPISWMLALVFSYAFFLCVERPFLAKRKRRPEERGAYGDQPVTVDPLPTV